MCRGLDESEIQQMINMESSKICDGEVVHSTKKVKIPAKVGKTKCCIETEVVPCDIPLLSKASLNRAAVLDLENDIETMLKQNNSCYVCNG